jgi:hypothetical protein
MDDFDVAWNAHDEEGVLKLFTEDAVARLVPALPEEPEADSVVRHAHCPVLVVRGATQHSET